MQSKPEAVKKPDYYEEKFWDRIARVYDTGFYLLLFGGEGRFRRNFVDFANPRKGEKVLDVCSGTGTLTSLTAERVGDSGTVVGVDLSAKMVAVAREKIKEGLPLTFERANSENLPFPEGMFDRSFVSLGLHEMPQTARRNTLGEIFRTLKPGGSLFVLDYNLPEGLLARLILKPFLKIVEGGAVYRMVLDGALTAEIGDAGFILGERKLLLAGMLQIIKADKPLVGL